MEVTTPETKRQVLEVMEALRRDDVKGWDMQPDGSYIKAESIFDKNDTSVPAEEVLISRGGSGAVWYIIGAVVLLAAIAAVLLAVLKRKGSSGTGAASIRL